MVTLQRMISTKLPKLQLTMRKNVKENY